MTAIETAILVIRALDDLEIPYMLVGSFSSSYYGIARSTKDVDLVVQLDDRSISEVDRALGPRFKLDRQMSFETITGTIKHVFTVDETSFQVEVFRLSDDPHDQERFRRRQCVEFQDQDTWLPTAEDVILTKLVWSSTGNRPKDADDVRDVIAVQGDAIDWDYVHRWCDEHGTRDLLDEIRASIPPI